MMPIKLQTSPLHGQPLEFNPSIKSNPFELDKVLLDVNPSHLNLDSASLN